MENMQEWGPQGLEFSIPGLDIKDWTEFITHYKLVLKKKDIKSEIYRGKDVRRRNFAAQKEEDRGGQNYLHFLFSK